MDDRIQAPKQLIDDLFRGDVSAGEVESKYEIVLPAINNWYCSLACGSQSVLAVLKDGVLMRLEPSRYDLKPKNREQEFLSSALFDRDISMVTIVGGAGTGKTLVTIAAAIQQTFVERKYAKIVITKPRTQITDGEDAMGEVPGDMVEKMGPQMLSYESAVAKALSKQGVDMWRHMIEKGTVQIIPLEMMRGVDFSGCFVICDESQNVGTNQFAALATRINADSKLVVMGDIEQVDRAHYDDVPMMRFAKHAMYMESPLTSFVELTEVERGPLTKLMVDIHRDLNRSRRPA